MTLVLLALHQYFEVYIGVCSFIGVKNTNTPQGLKTKNRIRSY